MQDVSEPRAAKPAVTFETKVWEGDYRTILDARRLDYAVSSNRFPFTSRQVFVNNVDDPQHAMRLGRRLVSDGVVDDVVLVEEHAAATLAHFDLTREELGRGYVYSISELVSLFLCRTEYLLHFSGDTLLSEPCDWMSDALEILARRADVAVVNLSWTADLGAVESESVARDGGFLLGYGFSDQMYLVRAPEFADRIYGESHAASERYPEYGGELFEKRVDAWMRNHGRLRATWMGSHYEHANIREAVSLGDRKSVV